MKRILTLLALAATLSASAEATHVKGYVKKDGTVVNAHERREPTKKAKVTKATRDERGRIQRSEAARHGRNAHGRGRLPARRSASPPCGKPPGAPASRRQVGSYNRG